MRCWRLLNTGTPAPGIPCDWFPVENAIADAEGLIHDASVALIVPQAYTKYFGKAQPNVACQFSEAWLRKPSSNPTDRILIALDLSEAFTDKSAGDASGLVTTTGTRALYVCHLDKTAIALSSDSTLVIFDGPKPRHLKPSESDDYRAKASLEAISGSLGEDTSLIDGIL